MTLRRKWEKARKTAGLEDVTLHDLRRTHGTLAAAAGVDVRFPPIHVRFAVDFKRTDPVAFSLRLTHCGHSLDYVFP
jgi:integrase